MVSILPSERTPFDVIMKQVGAGLQENLPQAMQKRGERQRGMQSIEDAQAKIAEMQKDGGKINPMDFAFEIAKIGANNPALERVLGPLSQSILSNAASSGIGQGLGDVSGGFGEGKSDSSTQPSMQTEFQPNLINPIAEQTQEPQPATAMEGKKTSTDVNSIANQYIGEIRPDLVNPASQYGAIASFDSELKQDLTPQEEGRLRQQLFDKYKNPAIVDPVIDRVREGIKTKYNESLAKYGFDKEKLSQIKDKWNDFTNGTDQRLEPHLSKYHEQGETQFPRTEEVLKNKYNQYASSFPVNMTSQQMHTNAMALLQNDINKLDALKAIPSMPPVRNAKDVEEYINLNKKAYKDLADMGFTEALKEDAILNKDMGNEEFHSLIWGDQTNKDLLNNIHSLKAPTEYSKITAASPAPRYNKNYEKEKEKYIGDLSSRLNKLKPEDDLILARSMVLDSGGDIKDFNQALNKAQQDGLKLSEFQRSQLQEINIPRVPPLWEIFQPEGIHFNPFINYLRGKK